MPTCKHINLVRRHSRIFFLLLALLLTGACASYDPDSLFEQAVVEAASAHWDEALGLCDKALQSRQSHLSSRILKGLCLHHLGDERKAEESLRAAAQLAPEDFGAQYFHGWIQCETGRYQDALPALRKAHQLRPDHPETLALLARCCLEQGLLEGIDYFNRLRKSKTYGQGSEIDNSIALLHLLRGDHTRAKNHLLAALRRDAGNPAVAQNLGVLHEKFLNQPHEAVRYYSMALVNSQKRGDDDRAATLRRHLQKLARDRRLGGQ